MTKAISDRRLDHSTTSLSAPEPQAHPGQPVDRGSGGHRLPPGSGAVRLASLPPHPGGLHQGPVQSRSPWQFSSEPTDNTRGRRCPSRRAAPSVVRRPSMGSRTTVGSQLISMRGRTPGTVAGPMPTCCPTSSVPSARSAVVMTGFMAAQASRRSPTWTGFTHLRGIHRRRRRIRNSAQCRLQRRTPELELATTSAPS